MNAYDANKNISLRAIIIHLLNVAVHNVLLVCYDISISQKSENAMQRNMLSDFIALISVLPEYRGISFRTVSINLSIVGQACFSKL